MRLIAIVLLGLLVSSCGVIDDISKSCDKSKAKKECRFLFGYSNSDQNEEIDSIQQELAVYKNSINSTHMQIQALNDTQLDYDTRLNSLQSDLYLLELNYSQLATQDSVVGYIDPCGDGTGFDEIVLRTRSGKLIAYFRDSSFEFLSLLTPGSYATTDRSACPFTVNSTYQVCDSLGCR